MRQGTKTKKSRNCLRDLDLPYFMRIFLTDGAEERIRFPRQPPNRIKSTKYFHCRINTKREHNSIGSL